MRKTLISFVVGAVLFGGASIALAAAFQVASGGTGWQAFTTGALIYGNGTSRLATTTAGTNGQGLFLLNGIPKWASASSTPTISATTSPFTTGQVAFANSNGAISTTATTTLSGSGVITVTAGASVLGASPITVACSTCSTTTGTVTSIAFGDGLVGGTITTSGNVNLKAYFATSTADTAGRVVYWNSTNAWPALLTSSANLTFSGSTLTVTNASTTNATASQSFFAQGNRVSGERYLSFILSTTTLWTSTSSVASPYGDSNVVYAPFTGTSATLQCGTNAGTLGLNVGGTYILASSTANINTFAISLTKGTAINITGGTPSGSPTTTSCTLTSTGY